MSKKGYKQTDVHKRKIGLANSIALKGRSLSVEHREKITSYNKSDEKIVSLKLKNIGKKLSADTKNKISDSNKGRVLSPITREMIGTANRGIKNGQFGRRYGKKLGSLKRQAMERDNFCCQRCGTSDKDVLIVDHNKPKSIHPELKSDINNLVTLCANCHLKKSRSDIKIIRKVLSEDEE